MKKFKLPNDCNNCLYISLTEDEQRNGLGGKCNWHYCNLYHKKVFHNSQSKDAHYISPCIECEEDSGYKECTHVERSRFYKIKDGE